MIARAIGGGRAVPGGLPADEAYGQVKHLRVWLEERDAFHVIGSITTGSAPGGAWYPRITLSMLAPSLARD
jgi:hypothetical protein